MSAKVLVAGLPNSGKTSLLKNLKNVLVFARDNKKYPFKQHHYNLTDDDVNNMATMIEIVSEKIEAYKEKLGNYPDTIVFDSISTIGTDIEKQCNRRYSGFEIWKQVNDETFAVVDFIESIVESDINVIITTHAVWDETSKNYIEVCKGSFGKKGGFLSTVDYSIYIELTASGNRIVNHKGKQLSRTLLDDLPDKQPVDDFDMQKYVEEVAAMRNTADEWSI